MLLRKSNTLSLTTGLVACLLSSAASAKTAATSAASAKSAATSATSSKSAAKSKFIYRAISQLRKIARSDPAADLKKALKKKDFRFVGVYDSISADGPSNGISYPSVDSVDVRRYEEPLAFQKARKGPNLIEGTGQLEGGVIPSKERKEHGRLNNLAQKYAAQYNRLLLAHLKKQPTRRIRHDPSISQELRKFANANPVLDWQKAKKSKDMKFIGLFGFTLLVPGVEKGQFNAYVKANGVHAIKGTSDARTSEEQSILQDKARAYAEKYNRLLLKYLQELQSGAKQ